MPSSKLQKAFLTEDLDTMKKYYPNIAEEEFMNLVKLDPTAKEESLKITKLFEELNLIHCTDSDIEKNIEESLTETRIPSNSKS